jgi:hypothetical protein
MGLNSVLSNALQTLPERPDLNIERIGDQHISLACGQMDPLPQEFFDRWDGRGQVTIWVGGWRWEALVEFPLESILVHLNHKLIREWE